MKGAVNICRARLPWRQEENFLGIRDDCVELTATQKITELTETKPGSKYTPNNTHGERDEAVSKLLFSFFFFLSSQREKMFLSL